MLCESYGFALGRHASGFSEDASGRLSSNTRQVIVRPGKWQLLRLRNPRRPQGKNIQPSDLVRASLVAYTAPGLAWQHPLTQTSSFKDSGLTAPPRLGRTRYTRPPEARLGLLGRSLGLSRLLRKLAPRTGTHPTGSTGSQDLNGELLWPFDWPFSVASEPTGACPSARGAQPCFRSA